MMRSRPLVIIGAGGFGREVHDVLEASASADSDVQFELLGFLDDGHPDEDLLAERGTRLLGPIRMLENMASDVGYVVGIGAGDVRRRLDDWATAAGRTAVTLVHPSATFGRNVALGDGTVVCAHVSLTTNIRIGRHSHLNLNTTVGHDAVLGDYVTVNPGATISGNVRLEDEVNIGTGAAVIQGLTVGLGAVVGACAAVVRDLPPGVTAVGVPARAWPIPRAER